MNTNTGQILRTPEEIEAAMRRGDNLIPLSEREAKRLEPMNRHERRKFAKLRQLGRMK